MNIMYNKPKHGSVYRIVVSLCPSRTLSMEVKCSAVYEHYSHSLPYACEQHIKEALWKAKHFILQSKAS